MLYTDEMIQDAHKLDYLLKTIEDMNPTDYYTQYSKDMNKINSMKEPQGLGFSARFDKDKNSLIINVNTTCHLEQINYCGYLCYIEGTTEKFYKVINADNALQYKTLLSKYINKLTVKKYLDVGFISVLHEIDRAL